MYQVLEASWIIAFLICISIPIYSIYVLFRDLVQFFFVPHSSNELNVFYPRFGIAAISYPEDNRYTKNQVLENLYQTRMIRFVIPHDQKYRRFYKTVEDYQQHIALKGRAKYEAKKSEEPDEAPVEKHEYSVACGIAGLADRKLVGEAARLEASLVRHNLGLRGIVIRYAKSLILLIWTTLVLGVGAILLDGFYRDGAANPKILATENALISATLLVWALFAPSIIKVPVRWIRAIGPKGADVKTGFDPQFAQFESRVGWLCFLSGLIAIGALVAGLLDPGNGMVKTLGT